MIVFVPGGAKNGKSGFAQDLAVQLARGEKRYYVATMIPVDLEDRERIRKHVADREGLGFETIECGADLLTCLNYDKNGSFLLDSVTALLQNVMFPRRKTTKWTLTRRKLARRTFLPLRKVSPTRSSSATTSTPTPSVTTKAPSATERV